MLRSRLLLLALLAGSVACPTVDDDDAVPTPDPGPGPLTNLTVAVSGANFELTWTNPADDDLAGALLVLRAAGAVGFAPADGVAYTVGQELGGGDVVVSLDAGATATVLVPATGAPFHFAGWAVDAAGQYSATAAVKDIDPIPGNVTQLVASATDEIALGWTDPPDTDLAGTLVVMRSGAAVAFTPAAGTSYADGEDLGEDQVVVFAAAGEATTVVTPPGCAVHFAAWAWDEAGQWSASPATASATRIQLGGQTATLAYDIGAGTVEIVEQPADLTLTASWGGGDGPGEGGLSTYGVELAVQNDTCRLLFNVKAVNDSMSDGVQIVPAPAQEAEARGRPQPDNPFHGTVWFDADKVFTYYGPQSILPGGSVQRELEFEHLTAFTGAVTVELHFIDAPMIYGGRAGGDVVAVDTSMSGMAHGLHFSANPERGGASGPGAQLRQGVISPDGRLIYAGEKRTPYVNVIDTSTLEVTGGADLSTAVSGEGNVGGVALSPDGASLYAVFNDGAHWRGYVDEGEAIATTVHLIEFEAATLNELRRVTLIPEDEHSRTGRSIAVRPDGSRLAVAVSDKEGDHRQVWFVDVGGFTVVDTDGVAEGVQALELPATSVGQAEYLAWSDTSDVVSVGYNDHGAGDGRRVTLDLVDAGTFEIRSVVPANGGSTASVPAVRDGKLYYTSRKGEISGPLTIVSFADGDQTTPDLYAPAERGAPTGRVDSRGVIFEPGNARYWVINHADAWAVDTTSDELIDTDGDAEDGVSPIEASLPMRAHMLVVSPY